MALVTTASDVLIQRLLHKANPYKLLMDIPQVEACSMMAKPGQYQSTRRFQNRAIHSRVRLPVCALTMDLRPAPSTICLRIPSPVEPSQVRLMVYITTMISRRAPLTICLPMPSRVALSQAMLPVYVLATFSIVIAISDPIIVSPNFFRPACNGSFKWCPFIEYLFALRHGKMFHLGSR